MAQINSLSELLPNQKAIKIPYTGGTQTFTVPFGYDATMDVYLWGGGGGGGGYDAHQGGSGAGGQFAYGKIQVSAGSHVTVSVGGPGGPGGSGGGAPGGYGGASFESIDSKIFTGANGGYSGPRPWSGGGGGGGGATVVAVNGIPQVVAGGGGGGGGGGCWSDGASAPGDTNPDATSLVYPAPLWGTYPTLLNESGIWGPDKYSGSFNGTWSVTFPESGNYTLYGTADNAFAYYINDVLVLQGSDWGHVYTNTLNIAAGTYSVTMHGDNWGGPASAALRIVAPSGTKIFDSSAPPATSNHAYTPAQLGQSHPGDGGGAGGGGGGWPGGNGGPCGGGDVGGSWGYSGTSYNAITAINASGRTPGNPQSPFYTSGYSIGGAPNSAGSSGYAVIVVSFKGLANVKRNGVWQPLVGSYFKSNGVWKFITGTWVKKNGTWVPAAGTSLALGAVDGSNYGSSQSGNRSYVVPPSPGGGSGDGGWGGDGGQGDGDGSGDGDGGE